MKKILINGINYTSSYFYDFPEKYDVVSKINPDADFHDLSLKYECIVNFYENKTGDFLEIFDDNFLYVKNLHQSCSSNNIKLIQISTANVYNRSHAWEENVENSELLNLHNDYLLSKRVCEKFLEQSGCLILRIKNSFDSRYHPDNWLVKTYKKDKISNMIDTFTYIPDLKKVIEYLIEKNSSGLYNVVQQSSGSDLYFFSSFLKTNKFSHLSPDESQHEQILTFSNDKTLECCDVNCTKLLQIFPSLHDLNAAVLLCWENIKNKVDIITELC